MTNRKVEFKIIDKEIGAWAVECPECPLKDALKLLEQKPRSCVTGIVTNCQGAVPLAHCDFCEGEQTFNPDTLTIGCRK